MRLKLLKDDKLLDNDKRRKALNSAKDRFDKTFRKVENKSITEQYKKGFENLDYSDYEDEKGTYRYLSEAQIEADTKHIRDNEGMVYDVIVYCIDEDNWAENAAPEDWILHGVAFGALYNDFWVCQVKVGRDSAPILEQLKKFVANTFVHETGHLVNNMTNHVLDINLSERLGKDWDKDIIHAAATDEKDNDYQDNIYEVAHLIDKAVEKRKSQYKSRLQEILRLLKKLLGLQKKYNKLKEDHLFEESVD